MIDSHLQCDWQQGRLVLEHVIYFGSKTSIHLWFIFLKRGHIRRPLKRPLSRTSSVSWLLSSANGLFVSRRASANSASLLHVLPPVFFAWSETRVATAFVRKTSDEIQEHLGGMILHFFKIKIQDIQEHSVQIQEHSSVLKLNNQIKKHLILSAPWTNPGLATADFARNIIEAGPLARRIDLLVAPSWRPPTRPAAGRGGGRAGARWPPEPTWPRRSPPGGRARQRRRTASTSAPRGLKHPAGTTWTTREVNCATHTTIRAQSKLHRRVSKVFGDVIIHDFRGLTATISIFFFKIVAPTDR